MKKQRTLAVILLCISLFVYFGARWYFAHSTKLLEIAKAQVFAFPFFIAALWCLSERSALLLRWAFAAVIIVGLTAVGFAYNHNSYSTRTVLIAPLKQDSFATQTRITQEAFEEASRRIGGMPFITSYELVASERDAAALLAKNRQIDSVIWGDQRWLKITVAQHTSSELLDNDAGGDWIRKFRRLQYVTKIPSFGLSYAPLRATAQFISLITAPSETTLRAASDMQAAWTTYAHRSYADLMLGNLHLREALRSSTYQYADLDCAIRAYEKGWSGLKLKDNLELKYALLNNLAVATYIRGAMEHDKSARLRARTWLGAVAKMPKALNRPASAANTSKVALKNILELRALVTKGKKIHD